MSFCLLVLKSTKHDTNDLYNVQCHVCTRVYTLHFKQLVVWNLGVYFAVRLDGVASSGAWHCTSADYEWHDTAQPAPAVVPTWPAVTVRTQHIRIVLALNSQWCVISEANHVLRLHILDVSH